jgi:cardiolipin synthase
MPSSRLVTVPNALTVLRLIAIPFFVAATMAGQYDLAFGLFVGAGVTDVFDGYIARRLNQKSSLGAFLDPAADKLMMFSAYILYTFRTGIEEKIPVWLTLTIFLRDILIVFFAYLLYTRINVRRFPPSVAGKISTVCQVTVVAGVIAANGVVRVIADPLLPILIPTALIMTLLSGYGYVRRARLRLDEMFEAA